MSKNYSPILVVSGDPKSIFLEIFFKSFKAAKRPLVLIVSKKVLKQQMNLFNYKFNLNEISNVKIDKAKLNNKVINFIDIKIKDTNNTREYLKKCFNIALKILKMTIFAWSKCLFFHFY